MIPPMMYSDPFCRITHLIKDEIRKHKWIEGEKSRSLSWKQARAEWTTAHREKYEKFLIESLSFPAATAVTEPVAEERQRFRGWRQTIEIAAQGPHVASVLLVTSHFHIRFSLEPDADRLAILYVASLSLNRQLSDGGTTHPVTLAVRFWRATRT